MASAEASGAPYGSQLHESRSLEADMALGAVDGVAEPRPDDPTYQEAIATAERHQPTEEELTDGPHRSASDAEKAVPLPARPDSSQSSVHSIRFKESEDTEEGSGMLEHNVKATFDPFRRRTRVWGILAFYIPLLVVPWTLTCVMAYRPLMAARYIDHTGWILPKTFDTNEAWQDAISVMNSVAAVLTIPVTSLILAEASVIWLQRDSVGQNPISLAHFFDIADRGWTDVEIIWTQIVDALNERGFNSFILQAAAFVLLCAVVLPLQQLLTHTKQLQVITCNHVLFSSREYGVSEMPDGCKVSYYDLPYAVKGHDAQLGLMTALPLWDVKERVKVHLATDTGGEHQSSIWNASTSSIGEIYDNSLVVDSIDPFWVAALPNGTTTGVLSEHALRLNYEVACAGIDFDDFPVSCPGARPFTVSLTTNPPDYGSSSWAAEDNSSLRVCVPGNFGESPWDRSRDVRTISEEIFFHSKIGGDPVGMFSGEGVSSFAMRCEVNTTRGYFELGNAFNDFVPQPLVERFPRGPDAERFNNYVESESNTVGDYPDYPYHRMGPVDDADWSWGVLMGDSASGYTWANHETYDYEYLMAPGPLAITAVALFGNESLFGTMTRANTINGSNAAARLCEAYRVPFLAARMYFNGYDVNGYACDSDEPDGTADQGGDQVPWDAASQLLQWFNIFSDPTNARGALGMGAFYACDALLYLSAQEAATYRPREIWTSDGRTTRKPAMTVPSMVILSVLLMAEVGILLWIAYYAWRTPTWTSTLKSLTVAQLANALEEDTLPPAGCRADEHAEVLRRLDGRVGVAVKPGSNNKAEVRRLAFGGSEPLNAARLRKRRLFALRRKPPGSKRQRSSANGAREDPTGNGGGSP